jgi:hypothetical protein
VSVDVGEVDSGSSGGIGGFSKRQLLIGAVVIGGGIGLIVFLMKRSSAAPSGENTATTSAPQAGALDVAYQNLATQLLGFRGDVSVANANLNQGQQDLLSAIGQESADRANSDSTLTGFLTANFGQIVTNQDRALTSILDTQNQVNNNANVLGSDIRSVGEKVATSGTPANQAPLQGAGGATIQDSIRASFEGYMDDASWAHRALSAGPVRTITQDRQN